MHFTKLHGCGNDFIFVDAIADASVRTALPEAGTKGNRGRIKRWGIEVRRLCDRHEGLGADGVIAVCPPSERAARGRTPAHLRMRIFNADGAEAQMCGNGMRCLARFARERLGLTANPLRVELAGRVLPVHVELKRGAFAAATVDMGRPSFGRAAVGAVAKDLAARRPGHAVAIEDRTGRFTGALVSMGNPHFVVFDDPDFPGRPLASSDLRRIDLSRAGRSIEHHPAFPDGINAHFAAVHSRRRVVMRTWERGAGATMACGSGACATVAAGIVAGRLARGSEISVGVPGGALRIRWDRRTGRMFMTGPAEEVCDGDVRIDVDGAQRPRVHPTLRTHRLSLRQPSLADCPRLIPLLRDGVIARSMLGIPHPYTEADARTWVVSHARRFRSGRSVGFVITARDRPAEIIGAIGLRFEEFGKIANLGYWIAQRHWNKGFASEAARAVVDCAFETLGLNRLQATHFLDNAASGSVMRNIGMRREGVLREHALKDGVGLDCAIYAITRRDWDKGRR